VSPSSDRRPELGEQITEIKQSLPDDSSGGQSPDDTEEVSQQQNANSSNHHQIYEIISTHDSVSLEDIISQTDTPLVDIADTLQVLCERNLIVKYSDSGDVKYEINDSGVISHE
jgi:DNA-binding MarR family transcriptional regulator